MQSQSWKAAPSWVSIIAYSTYSELPSISGDHLHPQQQTKPGDK
jgi:hypothetical protein